MLPSFEIQQFRTFAHLRIERLGRVNLIVGRNNAGKTMLLEALHLYAAGGDPLAIRNLLIGRDEVTSPPEGTEEAWLRVESLFHRGAGPPRKKWDIQLGPVEEAGERLRLFIQHPGVPLSEEDVRALPPSLRSAVPTGGSSAEAPYLVVLHPRRFGQVLLSSLASTRSERWPSSGWQPYLFPCVVVPAGGVPGRDLARWWDGITLSTAERQVVEGLNLMTPVEQVNLVEHPLRRGERVVMVRLRGEEFPVPLRSLGDGLARIFEIALALQWAHKRPSASRGNGWLGEPTSPPPDNSFLLVDEAENGIHYTVLPDLWQFLFRMAEQHNVQVFATTHSWDCIKGFQIAADREPDVSCMLIRLERREQAHKAVLFRRDELPYVTQDPVIEVR
jgi:hypothetical protein